MRDKANDNWIGDGYTAAAVAELPALVSCGSQKYVDPAFPGIWPAMRFVRVTIAFVFGRVVCHAIRQRDPVCGSEA